MKIELRDFPREKEIKLLDFPRAKIMMRVDTHTGTVQYLAGISDEYPHTDTLMRKMNGLQEAIDYINQE